MRYFAYRHVHFSVQFFIVGQPVHLVLVKVFVLYVEVDEFVLAFRVFGSDVFDDGGFPQTPQGFDEAVNRLLFALAHNLHRAVSQVLHVSGDVALFGFLHYKITQPDFLNPSLQYERRPLHAGFGICPYINTVIRACLAGAPGAETDSGQFWDRQGAGKPRRLRRTAGRKNLNHNRRRSAEG